MFNKQIMILFLAASLSFFACDDDKTTSSETDLCTVAGVEVSDMGPTGTDFEPVAGEEVLAVAGTEPVEAGTEPVEAGTDTEPVAGEEVLPEAGEETLPEDPTAGAEEDQPLPG